MKVEKEIKYIIFMPICSFIGIIIGIIVADCNNYNIGEGMALGWAHGYLVGVIIGLILSKIDKKKKKL